MVCLSFCLAQVLWPRLEAPLAKIEGTNPLGDWDQLFLFFFLFLLGMYVDCSLTHCSRSGFWILSCWCWEWGGGKEGGWSPLVDIPKHSLSWDVGPSNLRIPCRSGHALGPQGGSRVILGCGCLNLGGGVEEEKSSPTRVPPHHQLEGLPVPPSPPQPPSASSP